MDFEYPFQTTHQEFVAVSLLPMLGNGVVGPYRRVGFGNDRQREYVPRLGIEEDRLVASTYTFGAEEVLKAACVFVDDSPFPQAAKEPARRIGLLVPEPVGHYRVTDSHSASGRRKPCASIYPTQTV